MKLGSLEKKLNNKLPIYCILYLVIMPENDKEDFWAYHNTKIQKIGSKIINMIITISMNIKDVSDEKIYKELLHEFRHLDEYTGDGSFEAVIKYLNNKLSK